MESQANHSMPTQHPVRAESQEFNAIRRRPEGGDLERRASQATSKRSFGSDYRGRDGRRGRGKSVIGDGVAARIRFPRPARNRPDYPTRANGRRLTRAPVDFDSSRVIAETSASRLATTITRRRTHLEALELAVPRSVVHNALKIHFHILRSESRRTAALPWPPRGRAWSVHVSRWLLSSPYPGRTSPSSRSGASSAPSERRRRQWAGEGKL